MSTVMPLAYRPLSSRGRRFLLTYEQRQAVRERFKTLVRSNANYAAVAKELRVSWQTIARVVRGR